MIRFIHWRAWRSRRTATDNLSSNLLLMNGTSRSWKRLTTRRLLFINWWRFRKMDEITQAMKSMTTSERCWWRWDLFTIQLCQGTDPELIYNLLWLCMKLVNELWIRSMPWLVLPRNTLKAPFVTLTASLLISIFNYIWTTLSSYNRREIPQALPWISCF